MPQETLSSLAEGYRRDGQTPPLGSYAAFSSLWVVGLAGATFTAFTISDFLQIAYKAADKRGLQSS